VQAIVAANDDMALGAIEAASAAGLSIPILGFDALPEAIQAVNEGTLYGSVEQFPGGQSRTALQTIMAFIVRTARRRRAMSSCSRRSWSAKRTSWKLSASARCRAWKRRRRPRLLLQPSN
jgi:hypothetical protein